MNRYKVLALATTLALFAASPSYADKHDRGNHNGNRDRHEQRVDHDRHDDRRWENDQGEDHDGDHDRGRRTWFHDHGYSRLSLPARYYPAPGQCRFWYPGLPEWRQPAAQWNCGAAPRGAWLIRHPREDYRHVQVIVNEPSYSNQLVGEFEIGSGNFIRLVTNF
jgi:hypothetical protein